MYLNRFIYISLTSVEFSEDLCSRWIHATFKMATGTKFRAPMGEWAMLENVQCQLGGPVSVREEYWEQYYILLIPPSVRYELRGRGGQNIMANSNLIINY